MIVMTLDLASRTGWAVGDIAQPDPAAYGTWILPRTDGEGSAFCALQNELAEAFEKYQPDRLLIEAALSLHAISTPNVVNQQRGLRACAYAEAYRAGLSRFVISEIDSGTPRREILGLGRVSTDIAKRTVFQWARRKGWRPADHNTADSLLLWWWQKIRLASGSAAA
jgi:hypothetical protein